MTERIVTKTQGGIRFTRLGCAVGTIGISLPFLGVRRRFKTETVVR